MNWALTDKKTEPNVMWNQEILGRLRRELLWTLGEERMHGIFGRLGISYGSAQTSNKVKGENKDLSPEKNEFHFEVKNSGEAIEHLHFFQQPVSKSQCWLLAGYFTGWVSKKVGRPIFFLETECMAKKNAYCRFVGRSRHDWPTEDQEKLTYYDEDNLWIELDETREQLQLTKDRYQNLFEQSSVAIFIIDPETGKHLDANLAASQLTGYSQKELKDMNIFDLRSSDEHYQIIQDLKTLMANEFAPSSEIERILIRKDSSHRTVAQSCKVLSYGGQRVVQMVLRDITNLKESEQKEKILNQQLVRSERLSTIGRLAAGVAHELKNPLGAIRNAVYYIKNALKDQDILTTDPHIKEILGLAETEVDSSVKIIGELLDFSRVAELVPRKIQINSLLNDLKTILVVPSNVKLIWDLDMALPSAQVDPDRLRQVFTNVAQNSIQAMSHGGTLTIRSRKELNSSVDQSKPRELISIGFEDTGSGIDPLHLKKIFEPLFTTKARGTGLGLAISHNIIEKHGGTIHVTSQVGKGTSFVIRIPVEPPEERGEKEQ